MLQVVRSIAPQVDRMNVVLNEYEDIPEDLATIPNVLPIIPDEDTKDVGKFYPDVSDAQYVLLVDDDIVFPDTYVRETIARFQALGSKGFIGCYHGSVYLKEPPQPRPVKRFLRALKRSVSGAGNADATCPSARAHPADQRKVFTFSRRLDAATIVDQAGTGVTILQGSDMPEYAVMQDSQNFVDVRLARFAFERGLVTVCLPRAKGWLKPIRYEETIYHGFTQTNPKHVDDEILTFAYKNNRVGQPL